MEAREDDESSFVRSFYKRATNKQSVSVGHCNASHIVSQAGRKHVNWLLAFASYTAKFIISENTLAKSSLVGWLAFDRRRVRTASCRRLFLSFEIENEPRLGRDRVQSRRQIFRSTETEETLLIIEAGRQQKAEERNRYGRGHVARAIAGGLEGGLFFICKLSKVEILGSK